MVCLPRPPYGSPVNRPDCNQSVLPSPPTHTHQPVGSHGDSHPNSTKAGRFLGRSGRVSDRTSDPVGIMAGMGERSYAHGTGNTPLLGRTIGQVLDAAAISSPDQDALVVRHQ